ncbi:MAG: sugar phosphate isomerase/epimerase [Pirellulales bacterium]|nr:sugar phosphate isomerase/epimerase [Pirellulales bacterium]
MSYSAGNRREFLRSAVLTTAGFMGVSRLEHAAAAESTTTVPDWKMRLSCSSINFASLPIEKAVERIAALGFDAVDVWSAHAGCPHLDDVQKRLGAEGLARLLEKHKLKLYSFSVYKGGYPRYAELLGRSAALLKKSGLTVEHGCVAVRGSEGPCKPKELTATMKRFLEELKPELELAEKNDSHLAIENHGHALLNTIDSLKAFVDLNRHPRLGIALAPYHIQAVGGSVPEAVGVCGEQLRFFYAWQNGEGTQQLPGIGPADCKSWINALAKVNFRWPVNPFMHHEPPPREMSEALKRSCEYLRAC